jgi:superfamily II DNA or RNA helicase
VFEAILDSIRRNARAVAWQRGLQLARGGAVQVLECGPTGWTFAVENLGRRDRVTWSWQAWSCGCGAGGLPCVHVVAAAFALYAAGGLLGHVPRFIDDAARTGVRLRGAGDRLGLALVEHARDEHGAPVELPRVGAAQPGDPLHALLPPDAAALALTPEHATELLERLAGAFDVTLDGAPVIVDPAPLSQRFQRTITRNFAASGVALCGDTLRPLARPAAAPAPVPLDSLDAPAPPQPPYEVAPNEPPPDVNPVLEPRWHEDQDGAHDIAFHVPGKPEGAPPIPADRVARAWRSGTYAIEDDDGETVWLPRDWLARYGPLLEQFAAAKATTKKIPRWARPVAAELCAALDAPPPRELAGLATLAHGLEDIPHAPLPAGFVGALRDYQRVGVDWLSLLRDAEVGALLADDMGLGKTLQTLCAIRGRTLVVAPTSTLHNWAAEAARFRPDLRVHVYHGPRRALDPAADVTLTSHALLRLDKDDLSKETWDTLVLDEAQAIKEPTTALAAAAFAVPARWRVALSGTPVENRLTELWSLAHFLNPGLLGGRRDFVARYARPIEQGQARAAAELQTKIRPFVLRRRKSEVARELPPRTDVVLRCALDSHERSVYDGLRAAGQIDLLGRLAAGGDMLEALELLLRMRQAACHAALVPGQQAERSSKVDLLVDQLTQVTGEGHRALVFSQWTALLDLVEVPLKAAKIDYLRLDGGTVDRADVVARFQADGGPPVMLVSLRAGGTGINLTAADHVYLLDPWWNPAVEDQAADRAHRIGQSRPVFVHRLVAEDTVEEKILALHEHKRALALAAIGEAAASSLTREDLIELLR